MSTNFVTFVSFFWYLEVNAVATPLTLAPARETTPNGILSGKPMNVIRVTTLDIPVAMFRLLGQAFSHTNRPTTYWSTWCISLHTFPVVLTILVVYLGLCFGNGR